MEAFLPLAEFAATAANDIRGWTDPLIGREYALLRSREGTAFVDVSDPLHPFHLGLLPRPTFPSAWREIKVLGSFAFIVSEARDHGMQIFDLTRLHNVAINEDTGYGDVLGSTSCRGALVAVDTADPLDPTFAGCFAADGYTHDAQCGAYRGPDEEHRGRAICFNSNEDTLTIVDVSNQAAPMLLAHKPYAGSCYTHQGWLSEDRALPARRQTRRALGAPPRSYLFVWDVSDLDALAALSEGGDGIDDDAGGPRDYPEDQSCVGSEDASESLRLDVALGVRPLSPSGQFVPGWDRLGPSRGAGLGNGRRSRPGP